MKLFFATLSFISRLPVPERWVQGLDVADYVRGIVTFPLVGVLLGAISGGVLVILQPWCGAPLAALFCVLALALLTGGFHLDGLADTCDGVFPPGGASGCWRSCATAVSARMAVWRWCLCWQRKSSLLANCNCVTRR